MAGDGSTFLNDLIASRPALIGSTEADQVCALIDEILPHGAIEWLEVGAGNGRNLLRTISMLSNDRCIRAVALEPARVDITPENVEWLHVLVEEYTPDRSFDWVNMRHSAYYLRDPVGEIARLTDSLSKSGVLALTHWSRECILYRLHVAICGGPEQISCDGIEGVANALALTPGLALSPIQLFETRLCIDPMSNDRALAAAIYDLVRRGQPALNGAGPADVITDLLSRLDRPSLRVNGLLIVRRRAS